MKLRKKLFSVIFVICFAAVFTLTGTYEQDRLTTAEYILLSSADMLLLAFAGTKAEILEKTSKKRALSDSSGARLKK